MTMFSIYEMMEYGQLSHWAVMDINWSEEKMLHSWKCMNTTYTSKRGKLRLREVKQPDQGQDWLNPLHLMPPFIE